MSRTDSEAHAASQTDVEIPNNSREEVIDALKDWLHGHKRTRRTLTEGGKELLRDLVECPDAHGDTIEFIMGHSPTWDDAVHGLNTIDPADTGHPVDTRDQLAFVVHLTKCGLSRKQAIVQVLKDAGFTHREIADKMGVEKSTVDVHAARIDDKRWEAEALLEALDSGAGSEV